MEKLIILFDLNNILEKCKNGDRKSQKALYDRYKSLLFTICRRYISQYDRAEDVFAEGMVKIFKHLKDYQGNGSFEGWMKRIIVNQCLMYLRKNDVLHQASDLEFVFLAQQPKHDEKIDAQLVHKAIQELPPGYRTVLNLYIIEGYKHREIAELIGISINTSKSQLILAKKKLKEILHTKYGINAA